MAAGCKDTVYKQDTTFSLYLNASTTSPTSGCAPALAVSFNSYDYTTISDSIYNPTPLLYLPYPYPDSELFVEFRRWVSGSYCCHSCTHTYTAAGVYNATCTVTQQRTGARHQRTLPSRLVCRLLRRSLPHRDMCARTERPHLSAHQQALLTIIYGTSATAA